jgi:hypothetical protein
MKWLLTLLMPLMLAMSGCDKKVSKATIGLMDDTTKVAVALSTQWDGQAENLVSVKPDEDALNNQTFSYVSATFKVLALKCQNYNDALAAKATLAQSSAESISASVASLQVERKIVVQLQKKLKSVDPTKDDVIAIWKEQTVAKLDALIVSLKRLDESVQADLAPKAK